MQGHTRPHLQGLTCKANQTYLSCGRLLCLRGRLWEARVVGSRMKSRFSPKDGGACAQARSRGKAPEGGPAANQDQSERPPQGGGPTARMPAGEAPGDQDRPLAKRGLENLLHNQGTLFTGGGSHNEC